MNKNLVHTKNQLLDCLVKGEPTCVQTILDEFLENGVSLQSLYIDVLGTIQCQMGEMLNQGHITLVQEHRATQIILDNLSRIRQGFRVRKPLGLKAVVAALKGDSDLLAGRIFCDLLTLDGWTVDFLGGDTPVDELINHCKEITPEILGLSISDTSHLGRAQETIEKVKAQMPEIKTIIGGRGVMKNEDVKNVGADVVVKDGTQAISEARRVAGVRGSSNGLYQTLGEIGGRIHFFRKSQKMSQEKLAAASGLDRAYISSVENGKQNITIGALLKLSDALGIELSDLINGATNSEN